MAVFVFCVSEHVQRVVVISRMHSVRKQVRARWNRSVHRQSWHDRRRRCHGVAPDRNYEVLGVTCRARYQFAMQCCLRKTATLWY